MVEQRLKWGKIRGREGLLDCQLWWKLWSTRGYLKVESLVLWADSIEKDEEGGKDAVMRPAWCLGWPCY